MNPKKRKVLRTPLRLRLRIPISIPVTPLRITCTFSSHPGTNLAHHPNRTSVRPLSSTPAENFLIFILSSNLHIPHSYHPYPPHTNVHTLVLPPLSFPPSFLRPCIHLDSDLRYCIQPFRVIPIWCHFPTPRVLSRGYPHPIFHSITVVSSSRGLVPGLRLYQ
jgi:hypothetical protein